MKSSSEVSGDRQRTNSFASPAVPVKLCTTPPLPLLQILLLCAAVLGMDLAREGRLERTGQFAPSGAATHD